jgi:deazaflavin-dependent oxidoreductase (nitroreductase family)
LDGSSTGAGRTDADGTAWKPRTRISRWLNAATRFPRFQRFGIRMHARIYRVTHGHVLGRWFGGPVLVLETVGRRSGKRRLTPMVFLRDSERLIVLPINAGSQRVPSWWLNLREAHTATALVDGRPQRVRARELEGDERDLMWDRYAEMSPAVEDFRVYAKRGIPVVALEPDDGGPG